MPYSIMRRFSGAVFGALLFAMCLSPQAFASGPPTGTAVLSMPTTLSTSTVRATINPQGLSTTLTFYYRDETGVSEKQEFKTVNIGAGTTPVEVLATVVGLKPQAP